VGASPNLIDSATFAPGRNRGTDPYGVCDVESAWAPDEYRLNGTVTYDFAVLNLAADCDTIGEQTGTFGLFARSGSFARVRSTVQGYPGEAVFGTQKRMRGKIFRSQMRLVFYPMDTSGGQSGSPLWKQKASGDCVGPCGLAVHGYGTDPGSGGVWHDHNAAIRLTPYRVGQILDIAAQND
jgi:glutamyl endopeptidase